MILGGIKLASRLAELLHNSRSIHHLKSQVRAVSKMPGGNYDRNALVNRKIPEMKLASGMPPDSESRLGKNKNKFAVHGNAIITGGCGTLALAGVRALLENGLEGAALFDVNTEAASTAVSALLSEFPEEKFIFKKVDVTDADNVRLAVEETANELGSVDILCCYAGVVNCVHAIDMEPSQWRWVMEVNTTGAFLCAQAAARKMIKQGGGGSIVFISSLSGHTVNYPQPQVAYNVSKSALLHMKKCLAAEWARYGIRTNTISPGYMDTILNEGSGLEDARKVWNERNPMGRMGLPQELSGPLVLLCSDAGSYINGADLIVDGGASVF